MKGVEEAKLMLTMAGKDLRALHVMADSELVDDEIFGFHAQQAVEKSLKAWITALREEHAYKHDLHVLLVKLQSLNCDVADLWEFVDLNAFAVQYRYETYLSPDAPFDRQEIINKIQRLYNNVNRIIEEIEKHEGGI
ncbi:MAG: HEPN domain-containing protein [Candidatus Magnetobacterium sp. LHC-1]|uniref:HEPN domain-containing protein n=1 Tax=Candidatus Magnetobacterium casense TaxID=1455061 RepID=A0ABS6RTZ3_9BACT|nr:HEPN domain-containing protein [Candidatus Magnetobacterium casensis]MBF0608109.1 HEPN domain-containing protein [Nitrospirota bacterium]MBV6340095.1 HEPN domain-containing protein [Candidatus Magnetobacterium casensis]